MTQFVYMHNIILNKEKIKWSPIVLLKFNKVLTPIGSTIIRKILFFAY
jgi:hypothetical protein